MTTGRHMAQERGGQGRGQSAGAQLALLLRGWWEEAGTSRGGARPTQQALAARLGIDQTTLSRYLNPKHVSTAPLRVVDLLHVQLRAPATELEQARALCRGALRENGRQRAAEGDGEPAAPVSTADESDGTPAPRATPGAAPGTEESATPDTGAAHDRSASGRPRSRWLRPALVGAAMVVAFSAGMVAHERLSIQDHRDTADGAAGAASTSGTPYEWPLLRMGEEDQFTRARALQYLLKAHGYKVRADGFFRQDTWDAVMDFQQRKDLPADGKVGGQTWPELVKEVGPGSGTFEVRALQELLDNAGQGGTAVSGRFTAETIKDLRFFQRTYGLPATGRASVETWLALLVKQLPPVKAPGYQRAAPSPLPSASV
ncbi:peptidoglycan-binding protein [Streptomyces sp. NPDC050507]|uniref:peptidoglycan-binding domain-containing protein n=1 Tax=Streptomyces sp. NPDC050507 TaxID=3365619 RepID=UPI0037A0093B